MELNSDTAVRCKTPSQSLNQSINQSTNHCISHTGFVGAEETEYRELIRELWFGLYSRSPKYNTTDSSGFEHVFVGEIRKNTVKGFHSWIQLYLQEQAGLIDHQGYFRYDKVRFVCMCVCRYVCMYVVCMYVCMYVCVCACVRECMRACVYNYKQHTRLFSTEQPSMLLVYINNTHTYVWVYACMYMCTCV